MSKALRKASPFQERPLSTPRFADSIRIIDPEWDADANDDPVTGVGLDHLHQGNAFEAAYI